MAHLIDKDALVAEIERRRDAALMRQQNLEAIGQETVLNEMVAFELNRIISLLDTLEVKEVDLEKEVNDYFLTINLQDGEQITENTFRNIAKHFFELGLKAQKGE